MVRMFDAFVVATMQGVASSATNDTWAAPRRRAADRAVRLEAYGEFQAAVERAQFRLTILHSVHQAANNPLHIPARVAGFPILIRLMDESASDLAAVLVAWRKVKVLGTANTTRSADEWVKSLGEFVNCFRSAWYRPLRSRADLVRQRQVKTCLDQHARTFRCFAEADAAPRRRDRKAAAADADAVGR